MQSKTDGGDPDYITFDLKGKMLWWRQSASTPYKTISGKEAVGPYTFVVGNITDHSFDLVVKIVKNGVGAILYSVYGYIERGWQTTDGQYTIGLNSDDGKLVVKKGTTTLVSSSQVYGETASAPYKIVFTNAGDMKWLDDRGTALRTFSVKPGTGPFAGPFKLALDNAKDHSFDLVVKDADGTTLYPVFGYIERGWQTTDGQYSIGLNSDDGKLVVKKGTTTLVSSSQVYGETASAPYKIVFTNTGDMKWLDDRGTALRTFSVKPGTGPFAGPFKLALDNAKDHSFDLVVKDADGTTLYPVFGYIERGWQTTDGQYTIGLNSDDGNLVVAVTQGSTFVMGSRQVFGMNLADSVPYKIVFTNSGDMKWLDDKGTVLRVFSGAGTAPFKLAVDSSQVGKEALVVKDATGTTLYIVQQRS